MESFFLGAASACWLGILTSLSPCPLATNVAAISYIGKKTDNSRLVLWSGLLYMAGRSLAYLVLAAILVSSLMSMSRLSYFLQKYINVALGPLLIIVGLVLIGWIKINFSGSGVSDRMQRRVERSGIWGAGLLGMVFALSFCPVSAALFFGSLIPLAIKHSSRFIFPALYGIGTALPVLAFAFLVAMGTRFVASFFNRLTQFELWARRVTGVVFVLVGIYYSLIYIFNLPL